MCKTYLFRSEKFGSARVISAHLKGHDIMHVVIKQASYNNTGLQFFSQKCPLFGFCLNSTNFWSLIPNRKSVFGYLVRILQCCQFCVFQAEKSNFRNLLLKPFLPLLFMESSSTTIIIPARKKMLN